MAAAAAGAAPVGYALAGAVPMVAVPVRYPDGRVMYHVYPVAQHAAQVLLLPDEAISQLLSGYSASACNCLMRGGIELCNCSSWDIDWEGWGDDRGLTKGR